MRAKVAGLVPAIALAMACAGLAHAFAPASRAPLSPSLTWAASHGHVVMGQSRIILGAVAPASEGAMGGVVAGRKKGVGRKNKRTKSDESFPAVVRSYLAIFLMGSICRVFLQGLNRIRTVGQDEFHEILFKKDRNQPLLTVSNHMSVMDDPGIWGAIMPFWRMRPSQMRWSICTDDIYNAVPILTPFYRAGNTLPIKRRLPMEQPMFEAFFNKLNEGNWCHIFAEGRVRQPWRYQEGEAILGDFKPGVGRLIMRSDTLPIIVPMYHIGMHRMAPEHPATERAASSLQKFNLRGEEAVVYFGEPIDVGDIVSKWKPRLGDSAQAPWSHKSTPDELACHAEIANAIRSGVLELESQARMDYYGSRFLNSAYVSKEDDEESGESL